jgi:hypothetical protein
MHERISLLFAGKFASTTDNSLMVKVSSTDPKGVLVGLNGLSLVIDGYVNGSAGTAEVKVVEGTASRADGVAASDVYKYFEVTKS